MRLTPAAWRDSAAARWWREKPANEQVLYGVLIGVAVLTFIWLGLLRPLMDWQEQQTQRLENGQRLFHWISSNEAHARRVADRRAAGAPAEAGAIIPTITQAADAAGVRLSRLQPDGGGVSVVLQQQRFDHVIALVARLGASGDIIVTRASIDAHRTPGFVNAQLSLANAGSDG